MLSAKKQKKKVRGSELWGPLEAALRTRESTRNVNRELRSPVTTRCLLIGLAKLIQIIRTVLEKTAIWGVVMVQRSRNLTFSSEQTISSSGPSH